LEGRQVGGDDAQKVVGLTEQPLGLPDVRDRGDSLLERVNGGTVSAAHGDEDQYDPGADFCWPEETAADHDCAAAVTAARGEAMKLFVFTFC